MTDLADDLGEYEDPPAGAGEAAADTPPEADALADVFEKAKLAAMTPKLKEMIEVVSIAAGELEGAQERLLMVGARDEPYQPYMRRAAVLTATRNFLHLIEKKQDAVRGVLRGRG